MSNISITIGCPFEVIFHDNSFDKKSISSVYNSLSYRANYPYIIFLHEDIEFYTKNWGLVVQDILSDQKIGLLGLSGSTYKSKYPGIWSAAQKSTYRISGNNFKNDSIYKSLYHKVSVIDGCFIATRRDLVLNLQFDENLIGFHGYDIDLSLNVGRYFDLVVGKRIKFFHFSAGNQNLDWLSSTIYLHKKWKNHLPLSTEIIKESDMFFSDYLSLQNFYNSCYDNNYSTILIMRTYLLFITKFFALNHFRYTRKTFSFLFYK